MGLARKPTIGPKRCQRSSAHVEQSCIAALGEHLASDRVTLSAIQCAKADRHVRNLNRVAVSHASHRSDHPADTSESNYRAKILRKSLHCLKQREAGQHKPSHSCAKGRSPGFGRRRSAPAHWSARTGRLPLGLVVSDGGGASFLCSRRGSGYHAIFQTNMSALCRSAASLFRPRCRRRVNTLSYMTTAHDLSCWAPLARLDLGRDQWPAWT